MGSILAGGTIGGILGAKAGTDKRFELENISEAEFQILLEELRGLARISDKN